MWKKLLKQVKTENIKINAIIQNILILISDSEHIFGWTVNKNYKSISY